tara:strand:+ start:47999 stop:48388 length:390 start_codon:yes stop_codon:yes gene_type:complete
VKGTTRKMEDAKPKTVDEFIQIAPLEAQGLMVQLKKLIETTAPEAIGGISWNVPIYKYHGILVGFSLAKKHLSVGVDSIPDDVRKSLEEKGYKTGKKTIQIKFDQKIPTREIKQLIIEQAKLNKNQQQK